MGVLLGCIENVILYPYTKRGGGQVSVSRAEGGEG